MRSLSLSFSFVFFGFSEHHIYTLECTFKSYITINVRLLARRKIVRRDADVSTVCDNRAKNKVEKRNKEAEKENERQKDSFNLY